MFGLVNVLEKLVYSRTNFVTGLRVVHDRHFYGLHEFADPSFMAAPDLFGVRAKQPPQPVLVLVNRFVSGVGSFLILYLISLTQPAIVNAASGTPSSSWARICLQNFKPCG